MLADSIAVDRELRVARRAFAREIAGHRLAPWSMPTMAPPLASEMRLSAITAEPAPATPTPECRRPTVRTTLPVTLTSRRYCPQPSAMPAVGAFSTVLPVTAASASTPMPMPALSPGSVPAGRFGSRLRIEVALHDREAAAFVEVRHRDADGGAVDGVVGDHRALEPNSA